LSEKIVLPLGFDKATTGIPRCPSRSSSSQSLSFIRFNGTAIANTFAIYSSFLPIEPPLWCTLDRIGEDHLEFSLPLPLSLAPFLSLFSRALFPPLIHLAIVRYRYTATSQFARSRSEQWSAIVCSPIQRKGWPKRQEAIIYCS